MRVRLLTSVQQLEGISRAWAELAEHAKGRAFTHPYWCLPWWRRLGRGRPVVAVAESDGSLVALAPLHERRRAGLNIARFLGHGLGAVSEVLIAPGYEEASEVVWHAVIDDGNRYVELLEFEAGGGGLEALARRDPRCRRIENRDACPVVKVAGTFPDWWQQRDGELRRIVRRAERALAGAGVEHTVEVVTDRARVAQVLSEVIDVYDAAERVNPRQHLLRGQWASFTRELLDAAAEQDRLRLFVGRLDGRAVSFQLMLLGSGSLALWLNRFDPAQRQFAPGHLCLRASVEHAFDSGFAEVDLLIGPYRYKRMWADDGYETLTVHAASSPGRLMIGRGILAAAAQIRAVRRRRHG